jgi:CHAT domain-containing protein/tetratricopeptide (TPR) repeat protein
MKRRHPALWAVVPALCAVAPVEASQPPPPSAKAAASGSIAALPALQKAFEEAFAARDWDTAAKALEGSLAIQEQAVGPDSPVALTTLDTLAIARQLGGHWAEAEKLFRRELDARRRIEGESSAAIARLLTGIAFNLDQQNRFADAETLYRQAAEQQAELSGGGSVVAAEAMLTHASSLARLGRSQEAVDESERARDLLVRLKGADSAEAAHGHDSAGKLLNNLGRYAEAEQQLRRALEIRLRTAGEQGGETIASRNNLAIALTQQGKFAEAETLLRQALAARRAVSGDNSPLTADVLINLATVVQNGGNPKAAEPLLREALAIRLAASGPDHPATLTATTNLATCLHELGRFGEAEALARTAFDRRLRLHGENHPETAIAATNLAAQLGSLGHDVDAELLYRRALGIMQATNGEEHPDTATAYANLAYALDQQGRYAQAIELHRRALAIRRKMLGPNHPDVAENLGNLAFALAQQQDYAAADPLYREALELVRKAYGDDSLAGARGYNNLASNLDNLGRAEDAAPLYARALAIRRKLLGPEHPLTLISLNNVAYSDYNGGRRPRAIAAYRQVVAAERKVYAPGNPARTIALGNLAMAVSDDPGGNEEALALAREAAGIAARRRAGILSGAAAGGDSGSQARVRARSGETLRNDPLVTSFIALTQVDWRVAERDPAAAPALRAEAFAAAQEIDVSTAALAMARTAARAAAGGGRLGQLVAKQQVLSESVANLEKSYASAAGGKDAAEARRIGAEIDAQAAQLAGVDAEIARTFPDYYAMIAPAALQISELQKRLRPGEGLLLIVPSNGDMFSFAVTPQAVAWNRAPQRQIPMKREIARLLCQIDPQTCPAGPATDPPGPFEQQGYARFDRSLAYGLYRDLVAPVESVLTGVTSLYVTTTGTLATLPLGVLVTAPPEQGDDADPAVLARTPWLAERYAITVLPAVANLRAAEGAPGARGTGFVGYGAPALGDPAPPLVGRGTSAASPSGSTATNLADQHLLRTMAPLPGTMVELKAMASALGSSTRALRVGRRDTEQAVRADPALPQARVIAFATHGLLPRELGAYAEPGLVFTPPAVPSPGDDGVLAASEAADLRLHADWVVLSACNTAGAESGAESLSGLARAFLYAGAGSLLASYWRVSDEATAVLTVETLKADVALTRAEALRAAMRTVRTGHARDGAAVAGWNASWAHPAAWAPFSLISNRNK